jgi:pyruvate dehydrogenase E2 component (dihydrolipoamide acetyltransferase)
MFKILLARQGQTMEQGTLVRWIHQLNQPVGIGEELYEIETEKTIVPIEATRPGRIVRHVAVPGDTVQVGALLAVAADPDEEVTESQIDAMLADSAAASGPRNAAPVPAAVSTADTPTGRKVGVMPKARALAGELGVDLAAVKGSGADGMIVPDDVRRAHAAAERQAVATPEAPHTGKAGGRRVPLSPIARATVIALERAWQVPQFTQGILVDASVLVRGKETNTGKLGYMDFLLQAMVTAALEVPQVLVRLVDREAEYFDTIDLTIATATDQGLMIPVLRDAGAMTMAERAPAWRALVARAREGKLSADQVSGGTLALSNLGTRGVDYGTPLLPLGHAAIVFVGALETRPLVIEDRLEARPSLHVAITYDHRVIDGVLGSRFTGSLRKALLTSAV